MTEAQPRRSFPLMRIYVFLAALLVFLIARLLLARLERQTRNKLVAIVSAELAPVPVSADEVAGLNRTALADLTTQLEELGFVHRLDYRVRKGTAPPEGFARVFVHPDERCFAEIMAPGVVAPDQPLFVAINSHLQSDWSLGTSNIPPMTAHYFMRRPRVLRMHYPDDRVRQLFTRHRERRREVMSGLGLGVLSDLSTDLYFAKVREGMEAQKQNMQRAKPVRELAAAKAAAEKREQEWLGDYPVEAEKRRGAGMNGGVMA